jgi:hypothetical protein
MVPQNIRMVVNMVMPAGDGCSTSHREYARKSDRNHALSTMAKVDGVPNPKNQATFLSGRTNHLQDFAIHPQGSLSILLAGSTDGNGKVSGVPRNSRQSA